MINNSRQVAHFFKICLLCSKATSNKARFLNWSSWLDLRWIIWVATSTEMEEQERLRCAWSRLLKYKIMMQRSQNRLRPTSMTNQPSLSSIFAPYSPPRKGTWGQKDTHKMLLQSSGVRRAQMKISRCLQSPTSILGASKNFWKTFHQVWSLIRQHAR